MWDHDCCLELGRRAVELARDSGALEVLGAADNAYGQAAAFGGDFATAAVLTAEVEAVKDATRTRIPPHAAIAVAGIRGREAEATELIDGVITEATAAGQGTAVQYAHWARSVLMNGLGRYEEALASAVEASEDTPELYIAAWTLSELIEAATRTGNAELAQRALTRLAEHTEATDSDWVLGLHARGRALLSEGEAAEDLYREAIERLGRTRLRPDFARAHLLYGEWLRRGNRRVDARAELRAAYELFVTIGMEAFAERARGELQATGEKVRRRSVETRDDLTAAGAADRAARPGRAVEPGDRRAALPQPAHRGVAPAQGVHQARDPIPAGALARVAGVRDRAGPGLSRTPRVRSATAEDAGCPRVIAGARPAILGAWTRP